MWNLGAGISEGGHGRHTGLQQTADLQQTMSSIMLVGSLNTIANHSGPNDEQTRSGGQKLNDRVGQHKRRKCPPILGGGIQLLHSGGMNGLLVFTLLLVVPNLTTNRCMSVVTYGL